MWSGGNRALNLQIGVPDAKVLPPASLIEINCSAVGFTLIITRWCVPFAGCEKSQGIVSQGDPALKNLSQWSSNGAAAMCVQIWVTRSRAAPKMADAFLPFT